ncbi:MAG: DUF6686 family protein [Aestuariibaculum sp.]
MCHSLKKLAKTNNGELLLCEACNIFHLEFNNLYFEFDDEQFQLFKLYVSEVDCRFWECKYAQTSFKRKIPIPSMQENLVLMFSRQEMQELKVLIRQQSGSRFLNVDDIDYRLILN